MSGQVTFFKGLPSFPIATSGLFDYQSECHCSKTVTKLTDTLKVFDYQSECHCSKTVIPIIQGLTRLTTSQNATAPKRYLVNATLC